MTDSGNAGKPVRVEAVRGTQDLLPPETDRWQRAEAVIRETMRRYAFREIRTPVFESSELFRRPLGIGSDVVAKEMYEFTDRGGRTLALRPEGTAPVVRAYIEHGLYAKGPRQKLYYLGPIMRYDRPQAGRYRQHHQVGVEVFGNPAPSQDVEVIELAGALLAALNVPVRELVVNSGGCGQCRPEYERGLRAWAEAAEGLCGDCRGPRLTNNVLRILDCKNERCREASSGAPSIREALCPRCAEHDARVSAALSNLGISYRIEPRLVRGFDYYTRTVFEFVEPGKGAQGTLLGGGRYDGLVALLGGPETPAVGWGMGMERVLAAAVDAAPPRAARFAYVVAATPDATARVLEVARRLRHGGVACEAGMEGRSLNSQMRAAGSSGATHAVIVPVAGDVLAIKDLASGAQEEAGADDILARLLAESRSA